MLLRDTSRLNFRIAAISDSLSRMTLSRKPASEESPLGQGCGGGGKFLNFIYNLKGRKNTDFKFFVFFVSDIIFVLCHILSFARGKKFVFFRFYWFFSFSGIFDFDFSFDELGKVPT